jgi:hypothetical protein
MKQIKISDRLEKFLNVAGRFNESATQVLERCLQLDLEEFRTDLPYENWRDFKKAEKQKEN